MRLDEILLKPIISEKSLIKAREQRYVFTVAKNANKKQVADAAKKIFGVDVLQVLIENLPAENKFKGGKRFKIKKPSVKRATLLVKPGQKIDLFETIKEEN
ncbi:MAG: 50S ribosomal protein L23 [candidate division CPR1 bacterium GW2011_GWA2_42_17]|uniref:Large ribosomal subunit protein uL23 n=1 Tax=candidate division CPR1 bacterium GW2011_GWA2_42_17 TaxID=1618341 RepID=A0A0G0Z5C8_9BACT|nr:MAG: 50S ribosomal protein L23 [candidate division CPR1 bacterium GW2011_GWA2_42_17]